jgi:polyphosphate kinase
MQVTKSKQGLFIDRDLSWLYFNRRVLQEARDPKVPLLERLRFLGIFSNNLDEFFRVRVASHQRVIMMRKTFALKYNPEELLKQIQETVLQVQDEFQETYTQIIKELKAELIEIIDETKLSRFEIAEVEEYFRTEILPHIHPIVLNSKSTFPELNDKRIYLATHLYKSSNPLNRMYALFEMPTNVVSRFYRLKKKLSTTRIIMLDDIIRICLKQVFNIFDYDSFKAYTVKLTRDSELNIDNEGIESMIVKVSKSLKLRSKGKPVRFVFDENMPDELLKLFVKKYGLKEQNLIPGGRYHNFKDFINFPDLRIPKLVYPVIKPIQYKPFENAKKIFDAIKEADRMIFHPYHSFDYTERFIREAALDPSVIDIKVSLYRLARNSNIANALISAIKNGKSVTVIMELKARFDEEHNIYWAGKLQEAGAKMIYTTPKLKVHCKLCLITRVENKKKVRYLQCGTGNYNADTSVVYSDISLFTRNLKMTRDAEEVFNFLITSNHKPKIGHFLLAPINLKQGIIDLIDNEIRNAKKGKKAFIYAKLNSISDIQVIEHLYKASAAGVQIKLIVRGICCLVPENKLCSRNIEAKSIVGRYLEHSRYFIFGNNGNHKTFIASADWMERNFHARVETAIPILNKKLRNQILHVFETQWRDTAKARHLDLVSYNKIYTGPEHYNSQLKLYEELADY